MHHFDTLDGQHAQIAEYLRVLDMCQTEAEWNGVLANIIRHLFVLAMPGRTNSDIGLMAKRAVLEQRIADGFRPPKNRALLLLQAETDAHAIAKYSGARTIAEAVRWLQAVERTHQTQENPDGRPISDTEARRRVDRARQRAGLKLARAAPFGKKPPSF